MRRALLTSASATAVQQTVEYADGFSGTWVVPAGCAQIDKIELWGRGGAGQAGISLAAGDGGGGGAYVQLVNYPVTPGTSVSVRLDVANVFLAIGGTNLVVANGGSAGSAGGTGGTFSGVGGVTGANGQAGSLNVGTTSSGKGGDSGGVAFGTTGGTGGAARTTNGANNGGSPGGGGSGGRGNGIAGGTGGVAKTVITFTA